MRSNRKVYFLLFVTPVFLIFFSVVIIPFFMGIYYSFFQWDGMPTHPKLFVGLSNYRDLFSDKRFLNAVFLTGKYTLIAALTINIIGLGMALLVTTKLKVSNSLRTMFFMPNLIGGLILGFIWKFIFSQAFMLFGKTYQGNPLLSNWLVDENYALLAIVLVSTWQMAGYIMIIYIAGIQGVPKELLEAAKVDGANYFYRFKHILFPLIAPSFTVSLFLSLSSSFKIYNVNLSLTAGGPFNATELFAMNTFNEIFTYRRFGYGQSKAVMFFICVALITLIQVYTTKKREVEM